MASTIAITPGAGANVGVALYNSSTAYQLVIVGGETAVAVPANASDVPVKITAGRLCRVLVTATGTNPMQIFDNASAGSGTIIGAFAASPAVGTVMTFDMPAVNGITIKGSATNPAVTVSFI